jgi:pimeloyl-ACP methyl ester carboxylesterase
MIGDDSAEFLQCASCTRVRGYFATARIGPQVAVMSLKYTIAVGIVFLSGYLAAQESQFQGYANVGDIRMYYEMRGEGVPVLLLHGGAGNGREDWSKLCPILAKQYRLVVPDSRAQGRSTDSDKPLGYDLMTNDVIGLMDHLGIERAYVIGASDGGIIGLNMAMRYPDRVIGVVAYGANFHPDGLTSATVEWIENVTPENYGDDADADYLSVAPDPDQFGVMLEKVTSMWLSQPDWTEDDLAQIQTPVLVIDDTLGLTIRTDHVRTMAAAIPGARLVLIDDTDHAATSEKPEEFAGHVQAFFGEK